MQAKVDVEAASQKMWKLHMAAFRNVMVCECYIFKASIIVIVCFLNFLTAAYSCNFELPSDHNR